MTYTKQIPLTEVRLSLVTYQSFWHVECQEIKRTAKAIQLADGKGRKIWLPIAAIQVSEDNQQCGEIKEWFSPNYSQERWLGVA